MVGDGNNVCRSWVEAALRFGFTLRVASPQACELGADVRAWAQGQPDAMRARGEVPGAVEHVRDPREAVQGAAAVITDAWLSMSDDPGRTSHLALAAYQVNEKLMRHAAPGAIFMHCLPAHRGEEVTAEIFDGPCSVVFDEAENRLHAQAGILAWALGGMLPA